ncbi:MAG: ClpP family protease [Bacteroidota bacterium]
MQDNPLKNILGYIDEVRFNEKFIEQRKIFLWGPVMDFSAKDIVNRLLFLEAENPGKEISFYINSPGGSVTAGLSIMDAMNMITSPVSTICIGHAASMGAILLSAGKKGKRFIWPYGEVMIHQPSIGGYFSDEAANLEITAKQIKKTKELSAKILADNCGHTFEKIMEDFDRDYWMDAEESVKYGIVDAISRKV